MVLMCIVAAALMAQATGAAVGPSPLLTHAVKGRTMETKFEIAPPGQSQYRTYVSGTATRK